MYRPDVAIAAAAADNAKSSTSASESSTGLWPTGTWPAMGAATGGDTTINYVSVLRQELRFDPVVADSDTRSDLEALSAARLATLRKRMDSLSDASGLFAEFFERASLGIAIWSPDGHVFMANQALRQLFGSLPPPEYNIYDDRNDVAGVGHAIRRAFAGESVTLPTVWYHPCSVKSVAAGDDQRLALSISLSPLRNRMGVVEYVVASYHDHTEIELAHRLLRSQSEQLEQHIAARTGELAAANEELEAFSYSVSHDLRSPLRTIDAFAALLGEDKDSQLSPMAQDNLRRIRGATLRMSNLINDLLAFSRLGKQALQVETISPTALVEEVLRELEPKLRNRTVKVKIRKLPQCKADPALLREVFLNLLDNAVKFTSKREQARIEIGTRVQDQRVIWFVSDNGVGFDMAHYERLFGVFSRLHSPEEFEGTGVGLALVQRVIKRHGGHVWAQAEPGKGATFYFTLAD